MNKLIEYWNNIPVKYKVILLVAAVFGMSQHGFINVQIENMLVQIFYSQPSE